MFFITQAYFAIPKNSINSTHYFIMKILNKQELQQTASNHSSDIDFEVFINLYEICNEKPYSFLVIDTIFTSDRLKD